MKTLLLVPLAALCACGNSTQTSADAGLPRSAKAWFQHAYSLSSADIACTKDEECCVAIDGCNSSALIVAQKDLGTVQGELEFASKLAQEPNADVPCNACIPPAVVARCLGGKCVGRELYCVLSCRGDAGVPDADTTGWCTEPAYYGSDFVSKDHCGLEVPLPAGVTDDPTCGHGGGGGSYSFGCSPY